LPAGLPLPVLNPKRTRFQPKKFTSYERDGNGSDEAMFRRYNRWQSRFDQPDPYDGSYDAANPQSFNRYAYVQGDPVNFVDPDGLMMMLCMPGQYLGDGYWMSTCERLDTFGGFEPKQVGGAGGGGPQNPTATPQEKPPSDCANFVDELLKIYQQALNAKNSSSGPKKSPIDPKILAMKGARNLLTQGQQGALNKYRPVNAGDLGVNGFLFSLTEFNGAEVYRHISGGAWAANSGLVGVAGRAYQDYTDTKQQNDPNNNPERRAEGYVDRAATGAGWNVGTMMKKGIDNGTSPEKMREGMMKELCEY
jgi:RHS repeat-associated protein